MVSKAKFKAPKTLAACADLLFTTRNTRLQIEKQVEELKNQETQLKERLIAELPKGEATGISGKLARVSVLMKLGCEIRDAEETRAYLIKTKRWDLAYALRLKETAVKEMWDNGKEIPGVVPVEYPFVSIHKL